MIRGIESDREAGYRTVPAVYGVSRSILISGMLTFSWLVFALPGLVALRRRLAYVVLRIAANAVLLFLRRYATVNLGELEHRGTPASLGQRTLVSKTITVYEHGSVTVKGV